MLSRDDAVARLVDPATGAPLGTAFLIRDDIALTAFHCVGDLATAEVQRPDVTLRLRPGDVPASVMEFDTRLDVALLRLTAPLPDGASVLVPDTRMRIHDHYRALGFPMTETRVGLRSVTGTISGQTTRTEDDAPVVELYCREAAARLTLFGLSGGPVLAGRPEHVVGIARWQQPSADQPELASGGTFYATPMADVLERWPLLRVPVAAPTSRWRLRRGSPAYPIAALLAVAIAFTVFALIPFTEQAPPQPDEFPLTLGTAVTSGNVEQADSVDVYVLETKRDNLSVFFQRHDCGNNTFAPKAVIVRGGETLADNVSLDCHSHKSAARLAGAGRYEVRVEGPCKAEQEVLGGISLPSSDYCTGKYQFTAWESPVDGYPLRFGQPVHGDIQAPGSTDVYSFPATEGQYFGFTATTADMSWTLTGPDGLVIFSDTRSSLPSERYRLPRTGTYLLTAARGDERTAPYDFSAVLQSG